MLLTKRIERLLARAQQSRPGQVLERFNEDQGWFLATAVAFNALFSMFPIILSMLTVLGLLLQNPATLDQATSLITAVLPPETSEPVLEVVETTTRDTGIFGVISLIGLLWIGTGLFAALEAAMSVVYRVPPRSLFAGKLMGVAMIALFAGLIVLQIVASSIAQFVAEIAALLPLIGESIPTFLPLVGYVVSAFAAFFLCLAIYYVVPNLHLTFHDVLPGTTFSTVALVILVQAFPLYGRFAGGAGQYGQVFGLALLLMTWSNLVAHAFVIGAEINRVYQPGKQVTVLADEPSGEPEGVGTKATDGNRRESAA